MFAMTGSSSSKRWNAIDQCENCSLLNGHQMPASLPFHPDRKITGLIQTRLNARQNMTASYHVRLGSIERNMFTRLCCVLLGSCGTWFMLTAYLVNPYIAYCKSRSYHFWLISVVLFSKKAEPNQIRSRCVWCLYQKWRNCHHPPFPWP